MASDIIPELEQIKTLVESGEVAKAILALEKALNDNPANDDLLSVYVTLASATGELGRAYDCLQKLLRASGGDLKVGYHFGRASELAGIGDDTVDLFFQILMEDPSRPYPYAIIAGVFAETPHQVRSELFKSVGEKLLCTHEEFDLDPNAVNDFPGLREDDVTGEFRTDEFGKALFDKAQTIFGAIRPDDWRELRRISIFFYALNAEREALATQRIAAILLAVETGEVDADFSHLLSARRSGPAPEKVRQVLFVAAVMSPRVDKLAYGLRGQGVKVTLATVAGKGFFAARVALYDEIVDITSFRDLLALADRINPDICHLFINLDDGFYEGFLALSLWPENCVIDLYDLADPSVSPLRRMEENSETWRQFQFFARVQRILINHAPGICTRALSPKILRSHLETPGRAQKRCFLPEYSWGTKPERRKLSAGDGELHIVHGSTFWAELSRDSEWACIFWLGQKAEELGIHVHLYPVPAGPQDMSEYEELAERSSNFHLHAPLPYEQWLEEIQIYDVGLFHIHAPELEWEGRLPRMAGPEDVWANKFGDYIDAELFMILSWKTRTMPFLARRYGVGMSATPEEFLTAEFWRRVSHKVLHDGIDFSAAREVFSIQNHGRRLVDFYQEVINTGLYSVPSTETAANNQSSGGL